MKKKKEDRKVILILILILFILAFFRTFHNVYVIYKNDYQTRLTKNYGFCDKQGYGFVRTIIEKNNIRDNIRIINYSNSFASINSLFYNFGKNKIYNENYLILLNYNNNHNNNSIIIFNNFKYKIIDNYKNSCFFLKKSND